MDDQSNVMAAANAALDTTISPSAMQLRDWATQLDLIGENDGMGAWQTTDPVAAYLRQRAAPEPEAVDDGVLVVGGEKYMRDGKGRLVPLDQVRPIDKLIDETVRKIVGYAKPLAAQVTRFREHSFDDVDSLLDVIAQEYKVTLGGQKGNRTLTTVDGKLQVKVQVSDHIAFGPELEAAKALVDGCLKDWTEGARSELRAVVDRAFQVDKEGKVNTGELLALRRLDIRDDRWLRAMQALSDSIRVIGSKRYIRAYEADAHGKMQPIVIDVAAS